MSVKQNGKQPGDKQQNHKSQGGKGDIIQTSVHILDKEYVVGCRDEEREALHHSAEMLDTKMRDIRASGKVIGTERVAVMAALNIAYELLQEKNREQDYNEQMGKRLQAIQDKIESALHRNSQNREDEGTEPAAEQPE